MRKIIYMCLVLALLAFSVVGVSAEGDVAMIVETEATYATLSGAFSAVADGQTIQLLQDADINSVIALNAQGGRDITLNGDGNTITVNVSSFGAYDRGVIRVMTDYLTVENVTFNVEGSVTKALFDLRNNFGDTTKAATLTIGDDVSIINNGTAANASVHAIDCSTAKPMRPTLSISGTNVEITNYPTGIDAENALVTIDGDVTISADDASTGSGIYFRNGVLETSGAVTINNFATGIKLTSNTTTANIGDGTVIQNSTNGITVDNGPTVTFAGSIESTEAGIKFIYNNNNVTVEGGSITSAGTTDDTSAIYIPSGVNGNVLTVSDGVITGSAGSNGIFNGSAAVTVAGGTISTADTTTGHGGIRTTGGTVTVEGGAISGGNGIHAAGGTVTVTGGTISSTNYDGIRATAGTVNVEDGEISGCNRYGIFGYGGTVNVAGGTVSGTQEGIHLSSNTLTVTDGAISGNNGIIIDNGTATVTGGTISSTGTGDALRANAGSLTFGGTAAIDGARYGVYSAGAPTVNVTGGTISNCTQDAIRAEAGTTTVTDVTISDCSKGIRVEGASSPVLNFNGGTISACQYGIFYTNGTVNVTGGEITGCTSAGFRVGATGATMSGDPTIIDNNANVYIPSEGTVTLTGEFTGTIGINVAVGSLADSYNVIADRLLTDGTAVINNAKCIHNDLDSVYDVNTVYLIDGEYHWTSIPTFGVHSSSGIYQYETNEEVNLGILRFMTKINPDTQSDCVEYCGTYALRIDSFDTSYAVPEDQRYYAKYGSEETPIILSTEHKSVYTADVIDIPETQFDNLVYGISFVKLKGIENPVFTYRKNYLNEIEYISVNHSPGLPEQLGVKGGNIFPYQYDPDRLED